MSRERGSSERGVAPPPEGGDRRRSQELPRRANEATKRELRLARRVQVGLPLAFLVFVAVRHAWLVETEDLTPWKGGGFGMFSTVDAGGNRAVRVELVDRHGRRFDAALPSDMRAEVQLVRQLPSERLLGELAEALAARVWLPPDFRYDEPREPPPGLRDLAAVRSASFADPAGAEASFEQALQEPLPARRSIPRARAWEPVLGIPRRVIAVDELAVALLRPTFDGETGRLALEPLRRATAAGIPADRIHEELGGHVDLVRVE